MKTIKRSAVIIAITLVCLLTAQPIFVGAVDCHDVVSGLSSGKNSADVTPPVADLSTLRVDKTEVYPGDTVMVSVRVTDDLSGVNRVFFSFDNEHGATVSKFIYEPDNDGFYSWVLPIDDSTHHGWWVLCSLSLYDNNGNNKRYSSSTDDLSAAKFYVHNPDADVTPPVADLSTLWVDKTEVYPGDTVMVSVKVTDDLSGVNRVFFSFDNEHGATVSKFIYEPDNDGFYSWVLPIDDSTHHGWWVLRSLSLYDNNGNNKRYSSSTDDLSAADFLVLPLGVPPNNIDAACVLQSEAWINRTIHSDLYIGPEAILTVRGDVVIEGNIYVLGALIVSGNLTAESLHARNIFWGYTSTLYNGSVNFRSGSSNINSIVASNRPIPTIPLNLINGPVADENGIVAILQGETLPLADLFINGAKYDYYSNGTFILENFAVGRASKILFEMVDVFGKAHSHIFPIDNANAILRGDPNGDKKIDVTDAILLLRHITGLQDIEKDYGSEALERAKVTAGNKPIDVGDVILILRYIVGLVDHFPTEFFY